MRSCTICFGVAGCLCAWGRGLVPVRKTQGWPSPRCGMHRVRVWGATFSPWRRICRGPRFFKRGPTRKTGSPETALDNIRPGQVVFL